MKKDNGKFDFKGDWAEGKTAEEYADDLRSTCSFTRKVETWYWKGCKGETILTSPLLLFHFLF